MFESQEILVTARLVHTGTDITANALLIRDGRIAATGSSDDLRAAAPLARRIDMAGATITPGLIDAHVHLTEWALTRSQPDLSASTSPDHAVALLVTALEGRGKPTASGWIRGRGWSAHNWHDAVPDKATIDHVFPGRPVALQSHDMHSMWLNSTALSVAGINADTPDPPGGRIVRDPESGEPTGLLLENAAQLVTPHIPLPTFDETLRAVLEGQRVLHALGITGVHSFPGIHIPEPDPFSILQQMFEGDVLRLRILQHIAKEKLDAAISVGLRSGFGNDWLRIGGVKLFLDGALGSRTAWMREPYEGSSSRGDNVLARAELSEIVTKAAAAGIASTVHAIGDAAISLALDELSPSERRVAALPHRIEHVQCCPPERMREFAAARIVASMQPCHLMSDWRAADQHWGPRGAHTYALASLARSGATLAFGSDAPVEPIDPRRSLFAAVARQDPEHQPANGWYPEERINPVEALKGFTAGPALAAGLQGRQGILTEGAWADFAAWDVDPLAIEPDRIMSMRCVATCVGGELVFS